MTNTSPRKRFQIHLSTAIVMMFVAGALILKNVTPTHIKSIALDTDKGLAYTLVRNRYGWPREAIDTLPELTRKGSMFDYIDPNISYADLLLDMVTALAILFASWFLCEWLIRRRAARKGA